MKHDLIASIEQARREVRSGQRSGKPTRAVIVERAYNTTVEDLWDALTNRERITRWFLPIGGDLHLGGRYQLEGNAAGTVTACNPPEHLGLTWEFDDQLSWVNVTLSAGFDSNTVLRLEHTVPIDDHWQQFGPGAVGIGWDLTLLTLGYHLTTGEQATMDEELLAGPEGVEAMRRSGTAWCDADIASGTDIAVAGLAVERTIAAYTGQDLAETSAGEPPLEVERRSES